MDYWTTGWVRIKDLTPEIEKDMDRRAYNDAAKWGEAREYIAERNERLMRIERDSNRTA